MGYVLNSLISFVLVYKYSAISVFVFLSGFIIPLPSNTLLLTAGALARQGRMDAAAVFLVAILSNVAGDCLGFSLTRVWEKRIVTDAHLNRYPVVRYIEKFVRGHSGPTILVTRFFGTSGILANFLCGLAGVPFKRFFAYDVIGNAFDIAAFMLVGYELGSVTEHFTDIVQISGWIFFAAVMVFIAIKFFPLNLHFLERVDADRDDDYAECENNSEVEGEAELGRAQNYIPKSVD